MKDVNIRNIYLEDNKPVVFIKKKLKNFEILSEEEMKCFDYSDCLNGIEKFVRQHKKEWNLRDNESVGVLFEKAVRYNEEKFLQKVTYYKIKDSFPVRDNYFPISLNFLRTSSNSPLA